MQLVGEPIGGVLLIEPRVFADESSSFTDRFNRAKMAEPGFGHAFCTVEPDTRVAYKTTALHAPQSDRSVRWNAPRLGIEWPVDEEGATLSNKDAQAPLLAAIEGGL